MVHPKALTPLFLTETWERYGFYIVQGFLVLFMTSSLHFSDKKAYTLLGAYTALVYILPLAGGFIADRILGYRYSILTGAFLLLLGYGLTATLHSQLLYVGLATIIMGTGFLKPNISSYLGDFYTKNDPRRDSGFTIFYIGINLGVILAMWSAGYIQRYLGWHAVFIAAAIGMIIAIIIFILGFERYADYGLPLQIGQISPAFLRRFANKRSLMGLIVCGIFLCYLLLKQAAFANILLALVGAVTLFGLLSQIANYHGSERRKLLALIVLILISILFWSLFFQLFFSMNLFIDRAVNHSVFNIQVPTITFIALESIFIILLGPLFAILWRYLQLHGRDIHITIKFALAMFFTGLSMQVVVIGIHHPDSHGLISAGWIVLSYFALTLGELFLSPLGLSMVTQLSPTKLKGLMMGVWFMGTGFGGALAGVLAQQANVPQYMTNIDSIRSIYVHAFQNYAWLALATGLVILPLISWMKNSTQ